MSKERFLSLVKNPALLKAEDAPFIEELLKEFPFFQTAHLLAARCYKVSDSIHLQKQIKKAATHITDRKVLYELIEHFNVPPITKVPHDSTHTQDKESIDKEIIVEEKLITEVILPELEIEAVATEVFSDEIVEAEETSISEIVNIDLVSPSQEELKDPIEPVALELEANKSEAEIPLEREIKLALAESLYLKEFEQNIVVETEIKKTVIEEKSEFYEKPPETEEKANSEPEKLIVPQNETSSDFVAWLKKLQNNNENSSEEPEKPNAKVDSKESEKLVEAFMEKPVQRVKPVKQDFYSPVNMAKQSVSDNDFFVTETLAKIYIKQGNLAKAIKVYQNLSLKNPEKNNIFAAQIKILKEQLHNKSGK